MMTEWPKVSGCKPADIRLRRFESCSCYSKIKTFIFLEKLLHFKIMKTVAFPLRASPTEAGARPQRSGTASRPHSRSEALPLGDCCCAQRAARPHPLGKEETSRGEAFLSSGYRTGGLLLLLYPLGQNRIRTEWVAKNLK